MYLKKFVTFISKFRVPGLCEAALRMGCHRPCSFHGCPKRQLREQTSNCKIKKTWSNPPVQNGRVKSPFSGQAYVLQWTIKSRLSWWLITKGKKKYYPILTFWVLSWMSYNFLTYRIAHTIAKVKICERMFITISRSNAGSIFKKKDYH